MAGTAWRPFVGERAKLHIFLKKHNASYFFTSGTLSRCNHHRWADPIWRSPIGMSSRYVRSMESLVLFFEVDVRLSSFWNGSTLK
jgi:hypothetical protein